jgi:molybdopterin-guanine dinucleotide biosynthesis protein A
MACSSNAAAAILNGGRARRMAGADKARIEVEGTRIVHRQLAVLGERFDAVAMVGKSAVSPDDLPVEFVPDRLGGKGPVDGIAAGLAWSPEPWLFVVASDMPFLCLPLIDALLDARTSDSDIVCVGTLHRPQPLFALYHRRLLPFLDQALSEGQLRASELVTAPPAGVSVTRLPEAEARHLDPELRSFRNLNSPEDVLTSGGRIE